MIKLTKKFMRNQSDFPLSTRFLHIYNFQFDNFFEEQFITKQIQKKFIRNKQKMMLQKSRQSEKQQKSVQSKKQLLGLQDLSITSQRDGELEEEICEGQFFKCTFKNMQQFSNLYPDIFEQYPNSLVVKLSNFIKSFRRHTTAKLLHYELNCALILNQISFKLTKIKKYYENDQPLLNSFRLLEYYLKVHSITNLCRLAQMVKILINKKQVSYKWINEKKSAFIELKTSNKFHIQLRYGMELLLAIDNFTFILVKKCSHLKYTNPQLSGNLSNVNHVLFDNLPLQSRIKLIPKPQDIILPKIQQHFQNEDLQRQFHERTKGYFNKLYKQIFQFNFNNPPDEQLNELLFLILVAKNSGDNLLLQLLELIKKQKTKLQMTSKIIKTENLQQFIIKSNANFRVELPKLHLLIKNRGFMKLVSFLHQSDFKAIQKEINRFFYLKTNLSYRI